MEKITESLIVGFDNTNGQDNSVLIVGRQAKGDIKVINAFRGEEAEELYKKLSVKEEK